MSTIENNIVLITGASSGIGAAAAKQFAEKKVRLILAARRIDRITKLAEQLQTAFNVDALPLQLDVQDKAQVFSAIETLPSDWKNIDVLVNNAGLALETSNLQDGSVDHWDTMIDTNIRGLLYLTRAVLPGMIKQNSGHVINIGSVAGREYYPTGNIYSATKHAVRAITKSMRLDLLGTAIRVTEIAPGAVHTEFSEVRWNDKKRADEFYQNFDALTADDIADAIVYSATRPPHVNIEEMTIFPTVQASCNHIHRNDQAIKNPFDTN